MAKLIIENGRPVLRDDWNFEAFQMRANFLNLPLSNDQIVEAMKEVAQCSEDGAFVNWETIDQAFYNQYEENHA